MMSTAFEYYQSINRKVHVPKAFNFISRKENDAFWDEILPKAPQAYRLRGDLVIMERILPLQKFVRKALISQFCALDNTEIETILNHPQTSTVSPGFTSTRATHWGAAINGDDVEFVLGTSATEDQREDYRPNFQHRAIKLYLLDFGQCEAVDLTQDPDFVYQAFKGAMVIGDNQRFIPHYSRSLALFATFRQGYIEAGNIILSDKKLNNRFNIEDFMQEYEEYAEDFV